MVAEAGEWAWSSDRATAGIQDAPGWLDVAAILTRSHRDANQTAVYVLRRAANEPLQTVARRFRISPSRISNFQNVIERAPRSPQQTQLFATCNVKNCPDLFATLSFPLTPII
jgi:hypothetical protein